MKNPLAERTRGRPGRAEAVGLVGRWGIRAPTAGCAWRDGDDKLNVSVGKDFFSRRYIPTSEVCVQHKLGSLEGHDLYILVLPEVVPVLVIDWSQPR